MIAGVRAVNTSRADLGIVVDTDVDRSAVVAGNGTPINSNRYIALMSYIALRYGPCPLSYCAAIGDFLLQMLKVNHVADPQVPAGWQLGSVDFGDKRRLRS